MKNEMRLKDGLISKLLTEQTELQNASARGFKELESSRFSTNHIVSVEGMKEKAQKLI